jgi:hypothetical protein
MTTGPATTTGPQAETDAPIPYTLTPEADAYLDGLQAEVAAPEPEATL